MVLETTLTKMKKIKNKEKEEFIEMFENFERLIEENDGINENLQQETTTHWKMVYCKTKSEWEKIPQSRLPEDDPSSNQHRQQTQTQKNQWEKTQQNLLNLRYLWVGKWDSLLKYTIIWWRRYW